jgi:uncharacterized cupredoxin-like copper-binding protein
MRPRRRPPLALPLGLALAATLSVALAAWSWAQAQGRPRTRTVEITIHWSRFQPSEVHVRQGDTVRFVIHNTDPIDHELILGDEQVQDAMEHGTHASHDGSVPGQVSVPAKQTRSTTYTFSRPLSLAYACHLPGHYAYGMVGVVRVTASG